jgi:hypothetical protein
VQTLASWKRSWFTASSIYSVVQNDHAFNMLHHSVEVSRVEPKHEQMTFSRNNCQFRYAYATVRKFP